MPERQRVRQQLIDAVLEDDWSALHVYNEPNGRFVTYDAWAIKRQINRERIAREKGKKMPQTYKHK